MITTSYILGKRPCVRYTEEMVEEIFGLPRDKPKIRTIADLLKMDPKKFDDGWADMFWVGLVHSDREDILEKWLRKIGFNEWHYFFDDATDKQFKEGLELMA